MKKLLTAGLIFMGLNNPALAADYSFYLGVISGLGMGINFGLAAHFPVGPITLGAELEQAITDYEFAANINSTRYGAMLKMPLPRFATLSLHAGRENFTPSRDMRYRDSFSGREYDLAGYVNRNANYLALGLEFRWGDYTLTPKYMVKSVENGSSVVEYALIIGRYFELGALTIK